MDKRIRSPNYPALSLPAAIDKVGLLYKAQHTHSAPRSVAVKGMGYNSLNGASATAISALNKYGLLTRDGEEVKVSERAMQILHPNSPEERAEAIRGAAASPPLFIELSQRFPGPLPSEELLRNYLIRKGFAAGAVSSVILAYRETSEFVEREAEGYDSEAQPSKESHMHTESAAVLSPAAHQKTVQIQSGGRELVRYNFEGGGFIQVVAGGDIDTAEALDMLDTLVTLKREEIKKRKPKDTAPAAKPAEEGEEPEA